MSDDRIAGAATDELTTLGYQNKLPKGCRIWVEPQPVTYEMHYFLQSRTYTERFFAMHVSAEVADDWGGWYDKAFIGIAGACAAIPYVGPALSIAVEIGAQWFKEMSLNDDGSLTFYAAEHYIGTNFAGLDVTATPWPGIDWREWHKAVGLLRQGAAGLPPPKPAAGGGSGGGGGAANPGFTPVSTDAPQHIAPPLILRGAVQGHPLDIGD